MLCSLVQGNKACNKAPLCLRCYIPTQKCIETIRNGSNIKKNLIRWRFIWLLIGWAGEVNCYHHLCKRCADMSAQCADTSAKLADMPATVCKCLWAAVWTVDDQNSPNRICHHTNLEGSQTSHPLYDRYFTPHSEFGASTNMFRKLEVNLNLLYWARRNGRTTAGVVNTDMSAMSSYDWISVRIQP
jgi:hypothetical protein